MPCLLKDRAGTLLSLCFSSVNRQALPHFELYSLPKLGNLDVDENGRTLLMRAARKEPSVVATMIKAGANFNLEIREFLFRVLSSIAKKLEPCKILCPTSDVP